MWLQLELILTAATLCIAIIGVISGLFGMNLHTTHEDSYTTFVMVRCLPESLMQFHIRQYHFTHVALKASMCPVLQMPFSEICLAPIGCTGSALCKIQEQCLTECGELKAGQILCAHTRYP